MPEAMSSMIDGSVADPSVDASGNKRKRVSIEQSARDKAKRCLALPDQIRLISFCTKP